MGLVEKLFSTFDSTMMDGANKVVNAWNWTTGKTKGELADLVIGTAPYIGTTCVALTSSSVGELVLAGAYMALSFKSKSIFKRFNDKVTYEEDSARAKNMLSLKTEYLKEEAKFFGTMLGGISIGGVAVSGIQYDDLPYGASLFVPLILHSASTYLIRADSPPPRKNSFSRDMNYIKERTRKLVPVLQKI